MGVLFVYENSAFRISWTSNSPAQYFRWCLADPNELQSSFGSAGSPLWKRKRCQGHSPLISTSSDQLRNVRTSTISPSTPTLEVEDRKSTRLNSSHSQISYAVFCLKKKI